MTGIPISRKRTNDTGWCARSSTPEAATFAAAATIVALPPKQAPSASAHQSSSWNPSPGAFSVSTTGIIAAVNGMLSTSAEPPAAPQRITIASAVREPSVRSARASAIRSITPRSSSPPTITKRPTKKKIVDHSTRSSACSTSSAATSSITVAPVSATTAGSRCSVVCRKKAMIVPPSTASDRFT